MMFETQRLWVRRYTKGDEEHFYQLNSDPCAMRYIRSPKTRQQAAEFFQENISYYDHFPSFGRWAMIQKSDAAFIGSFMLRPSNVVADKIELGYAMFEKYWGLGYATESVIGGLELAFYRLKVAEVIAIAQPENLSSKKVLLKCGFDLQCDLNDKGRLVNLFTKSNVLNG